MIRVLAICLLLVSTGAACSEAVGGSVKTYEVRVTGDAGAFTGNLTVTDKDGAVQQQSVQGTAPQTFTAEGRSVVMVAQKKETAGTLKVEIAEGDKIVKSGETTADYGVVTVSQ